MAYSLEKSANGKKRVEALPPFLEPSPVGDVRAESAAHLERLAQLYLELEAECARSRELIKISASLLRND